MIIINSYGKHEQMEELSVQSEESENDDVSLCMSERSHNNNK